MSHEADARVERRGDAATLAKRPRGVIRFFIACSVVMIVTRSGLNTFMHHTAWRDELGMFSVPLPLPSAAEREQIGNGRSARYASLSERLLAVGASVLRFANPLPSAKTHPRLTSTEAFAKYAAVWTHTRLEFLGRLIGVDERWTMFSPSVGTARTVVRAVLTYSDGTKVAVRSRAEPEDLTRFVRPFAQRRLQHDLNLLQLNDVRLNWCRYLARTHPTTGRGAPLQLVDLFEVRHVLAPPESDAEQHWQAENARPLPASPSWRFDVASGVLTEVRASGEAEITDESN